MAVTISVRFDANVKSFDLTHVLRGYTDTAQAESTIVSAMTTATTVFGPHQERTVTSFLSWIAA